MKIAILGYGKEGKAAEAYFKAQAKEQGQPAPEIEIFAQIDNSGLDKIDTTCYNEIMRSPSVPPRAGFSSGTRYFFDHCPAPIIGVTGTKGKGTTCSFIATLLRALGHNVHLVGNIGIPAIGELDKISKNDVVVYEMSSFQLWDLAKSPHIAVVLRIEPDHLNVHRDFEDYVGAKAHIAAYQGTDDAVVYFAGNPDSERIAKRSKGRKIPYPLAKKPAQLVQLLDALTVPGEHNREDAEAALTAVAAFLCVSLEELIAQHFDALRQALASFKGLPHHIELTRTLRGVEYYDDSFATAKPALEVALKAFGERPLFLIAGGQNKGTDLGPIKRVIFDTPTLEQAILMGETSTALAEGEDATKYTLVGSLAEALATAQKLAEAHGDTGHGAPVVLMSPGAASFDMFKDYYDRGEQFHKIVKTLK